MKSLIAHVLTLALLIGTQSASACCLFPFGPTYSAGYAPWGWGTAWSPPAYGYGPVNYSAGYYGYSSGGYGNTYGSSYGSSCNTGCCNVCASDCGVACGSGYGSNCVGTETRKVPEPENGYDSNNRSRTFGNDNDGKPADEFDRSNSPARPADRWDPTKPRDRDSLGNGGTGLPGLGTDDPPDSFGTAPPDRTSPRPFGTETDPGSFEDRFNSRGTGGFGEDIDSIPGSSRFRPSTEEPDPTDGEHSARKPEVTTPIEEPAGDATAPEPAGVAVPGDATAPNADTAPGNETKAEDFLPPDTTQSRSSHFDVLSMKRLAGSGYVRNRVSSQISSSQTKDRPVRWISVPLPADRVRL